jgi:predicted RNA-binding Zn-ribbon protein involved in translation (DUF1610 family)
LLILTVAFWGIPLSPDKFVFDWVFRIGAPLGAIFTLIHLLRRPKDASLKERLAAVSPAADTTCPFCGTALLQLSTRVSCPKCGVVRA